MLISCQVNVIPTNNETNSDNSTTIETETSATENTETHEESNNENSTHVETDTETEKKEEL